jgi:hypothetical protein
MRRTQERDKREITFCGQRKREQEIGLDERQHRLEAKEQDTRDIFKRHGLTRSERGRERAIDATFGRGSIGDKELFGR